MTAELTCHQRFGTTIIDYATFPLASPQQAIQNFLSSSMPAARPLRGLSFEFALSPPSTLTSVGGGSTATPPSSVTDTTRNPSDLTDMYFVHRDTDGQVVAVLRLEGDGDHWAVGEASGCLAGSDGGGDDGSSTATTGAVPSPVTTYPVPDTLALPARSTSSTTSSTSTTSTSVMGG